MAPSREYWAQTADVRHHYYPFIEGVSERTYTDEQLAHIDDGLGCEFEGETFTPYQCTQFQRSIERSIRKWRRREAAAVTDEEKTVYRARLRTLNTKYQEFSKAAGLPEQRDRMKVVWK